MKKITNLKKAAILTLGLFIFSCNNNDDIELDNSEATQEEISEKRVTMYDHMDKLSVVEMDNGDYRLGDMVYHRSSLTKEPTPWPTLDENTPPDQSSNTESASRIGARLWPNNTVVYQFSSNLGTNLRNLTLSAMRAWESRTNIKFKQRNGEGTYVNIFYDSSQYRTAYATIGAGGVVAIGYDPDLTLLIHELGHTLGLVHEQTRSDRDNYVTVHYNNIEESAKFNYAKTSDVRRLTTSFDLNSIMLYQSHFFSKNGYWTMTTKTGGYLNGAQRSISNLDAQGVNILYPVINNNNNNDPCAGVPTWRSGYYPIGSRVIYNGTLYYLNNYNQWVVIRRC